MTLLVTAKLAGMLHYDTTGDSKLVGMLRYDTTGDSKLVWSA